MDVYFLLREEYDSELNSYIYILQEIATNGREVQFPCWLILSYDWVMIDGFWIDNRIY
jgi:hypothetical protein